MSHIETVGRDTRSYRQGLVLGLTMAEVFLLLVFALLIALAALWQSEKKAREDAEKKYGVDISTTPVISVSADDKKMLDDFKAVVSTAGQDKVSKALEDLRQGRDLFPLSKPEKQFVDEVRRQQGGATPQKITDDWRHLTAAAQPLDRLPGRLAAGTAVENVVPGITDSKRIGHLIGLGLAAERKGEHDWPPIINLSEAKGYFFEKGKAELTADFEQQLKSAVVPQLQQLTKQYGVTTIEVIGHTDEQRISQRTSNLDWFLIDIANNTGKVSALIPADNAGLGLARAAAVMRVLTQDERLKTYTVLPLSGGQLINVGDKVTQGGGADDRERRRIEIRLRRPNSAEQPVTDASGRDMKR